MRAFILSAAILTLTLATQAQQPQLAPTPPMGWNSWDAYGSAVTESEVRANADAKATQLKPFGWEYITVDIQWYEPHAKAHGYRPGAVLVTDAHGRLLPATNRFPSAANGAGFKPLADYVHSLGLKFGIHIMRGIPRQAVAQNEPILGTGFYATDIANTSSTCEWNTDMYGVDMSKSGAQAYYDSLAALYASWGVDLIKADDMGRPYHAEEVAALHRAIVKTGRPMVLSISPGAALVANVNSLRANANLWRISDDIWDQWPLIKKNFTYAANWAPYIEANHWPDGDMLPLGHIGIRAHVGDDRLSRLTHDEQQTLMTLWVMMRSPLIFGGDIPTLDPFTRSLLTNKEVINIDQHSAGNRVLSQTEDFSTWTATSADGKATYIAFFNLSDKPQPYDMNFPRQSSSQSRLYAVHDVWTGKSLGPRGFVSGQLAPHASLLYELIPSASF